MTRKLLIFRRKIAQLRPRPIFVRVKLFPGRLKFGGMILSWAGLVSASQFRGDSSCLIVVGLGPGSGPLSGEASRPPWGHSNTNNTNNTTTPQQPQQWQCFHYTLSQQQPPHTSYQPTFAKFQSSLVSKDSYNCQLVMILNHVFIDSCESERHCKIREGC